MRHISVALLVVGLVQPIGAQNASKLDEAIKNDLIITDPATLRPCALGALVPQIGSQAGIPVGFEHTDDCVLGPWIGVRPGERRNRSLGTMSAREAFDYLMTLMPAFSWRDINGVVVVRPKAAWDDPRNVLNVPTKPFSVTNQRIGDVLHTVLRNVDSNALYPHRDVPKGGRPIDRPVTVDFAGGALLEALNAVVQADGELEWQLGYAGGPPVLALGTLHFGGGIVMAPVALPALR